MSLSTFRKNLFQSFYLMRDTRTTFDVYHRRKVYRISVEATGEKVTTPYKTKRPLKVLPAALVETTECKDCGSLLVNNVCVNRNCPSVIATSSV